MTKSTKRFYIFSSIFFACFVGYFFFHIHVYGWLSDFTGHLNFIYQNSINNYTLYNMLLAWLYLLIQNKVIIEIIYVLLLALSKIAIAFIVRWYLLNKNKEKPFCSETVINIISFVILFIGGGYLPVWNWEFGKEMYIWWGQPNLWHNPTILFMEPFALLAIIYLEKFIVKKQQNFKTWLLLTVFITLSTLLKPSFVCGAVPTLAIIFLYLLIKNKFKNFKEIAICCCAFIPSGLALIYQVFALFGSSSSSIGLTATGLFKSWTYTFILPLVILAPIVVYIYNRKRLEFTDVFSIIFYLVAFMEGNFITETGGRAGHGNFVWTYMASLLFLFIFSLICFAKNYKNTPKKMRIFIIVLYAIHLILGLTYLLRILTTGGYYI